MAHQGTGGGRIGDAGRSGASSIELANGRGWPRSLSGLVAASMSLTGPVPTLAEAEAEDQELEEIIVTGSRIPRPDYESASPVVTVPSDRFEQTPRVTVEAILDRYPQFSLGTNGSSNNGDSDGQAWLNLRGLGPQATLVLVDGRRLAPANGNGVPDVNVIPTSLIERVEILTGGASAVYGTDALAGVVNMHLLQHYDGIEASGSWGQTGHGDGEEYTVTLTGGTGFADGRGEIMGSVAYSDRALVTQAARQYSRAALGWYGPGTDGVGPGGQFLPQGSANIVEGRIRFANNRPSEDAFNALFETYGYAPGTVPYPQDIAFNTDGTVFTIGDGATPGSVANFRGVKDPLTYNDRWYTYNYAPWQAMQMPLERTSAFLNGSFEFDEAAELYALGIYANYAVNEQVAPTPIPNVFVPVTNPYISPDLRLLLDSRLTEPEAPFRLSKRTLETGPRIMKHDHSFYQFTAGLRGRVLGDWEYNGYVQYGLNDQRFNMTGNVSVSKFEELLWAPDGGQALCGGADPFGLNSMSAECADYIAVDLKQTFNTQQFITEVSVTGTPFELPAGSVDTVFGLFYQRNQFEQHPDPASQRILPDGRPDIAGSSFSTEAMSADDYNVDAYTEVLLPLLVNLPGVRSLQTVLGYRWSDYGSAGNVSAYKAELLYEPVDQVHMRGSFQHAVRAPSIYERYYPQTPQNVGIPNPDPCSVDSDQRTGPDGAAVRALCLEQGVPASEIDLFYDYSGGAPGFAGGNPDLVPEKGRTWTVGLVLDSLFGLPALEHLQVALDWWDIRQSNAIYQTAASWGVSNCYDSRYNPDFSASNQFCHWFSREPDSGYIVDAYTIYRNMAVQSTYGIDLQIDWHMPAGPGEIGASWVLSWLAYFDLQTLPKGPKESWGGTVGQPDWQWNFDANYRVGGLTFDANWRYVGHVNGAFPGEQSFQVPVRNYVDLTASYEFGPGVLDGLTLRLGMNNVLDDDPPIFPAYWDANSYGGSYDLLGRSYWLGASYSFRSSGK
jgi:iron complex outermembrane receptor protein